MPEYSVNKNGSITVHARYTRRGVCTLVYVFPEDPANTKKLLKKRPEFKDARLASIYKVRSSARLIRRIFCRMLELSLLRVANGDLFMFPGVTGAHIVLKSIPKDQVKMLRQAGKYADYDIVKADFKIPKFAFDFGPKRKNFDCEVYVPKHIRKVSYENTINRTIPWITIHKTITDDF